MKLKRHVSIVSQTASQLVVSLVVRDVTDTKTYGSAQITFVKPLVKTVVQALMQSTVSTIMQGNLLEAVIDFENEVSEWP